MKDAKDTQTIDGLKRGRGRPAKYGSPAERQKAYRARKAELTISLIEITKVTEKQIRETVKRSGQKGQSKEAIEIHYISATGKFNLWQELTKGTDIYQDRKEYFLMLIAEIKGHSS